MPVKKTPGVISTSLAAAAPAAAAPPAPPPSRRRVVGVRNGRPGVVAALPAAVRLRRPILTLSRARYPRLLPLIDQLRHVAEHFEPGHRV